jgi:hypothetical protein
MLLKNYFKYLSTFVRCVSVQRAQGFRLNGLYNHWFEACPHFLLPQSPRLGGIRRVESRQLTNTDYELWEAVNSISDLGEVRERKSLEGRQSSVSTE